MAAAARYLYVGFIILAVSGATAIYLNFQGARCLIALAQLERSVVAPNIVEDMERNCAIVTNSYVYSIYSILTGVALVVIGFLRKRKNNAS